MTQMEEFEKSEEEPEIDQLLNEETTDEEMEIVFVNEIEDDLIQDLDYKCRSCGESFSEEEAMKKHINIFHKDKKVHKCTSCGKSFSHPGYLKKHGLKCYKCESCGKLFSQAGNLMKHIHTIHEGHKDFKCGSCGKSFSQVGS